ncbi:MAG: 50S ribosomal protein L9 [Gemmataceae bacterium]
MKKRQQVPHGKNGNLKLVLTEDVMYLGKQGDLVEVRPGYGRNYLLPRGLATIPTPHNLQLLERFKIRVRQAREARIADLKALAEQITKMDGITVEAQANDEGHLYGSVGPAEISKALRSRICP